MQFFIALAIVTTASAAYLLHQFWRRGLAGASSTNAERDSEDELKAA